jgi:DNA-binding NarL/FixJ family response regulator
METVGSLSASSGVRMHRVILTLSDDRSQVMQMIARAPSGYVVEIKKPSRSLEQNARYWVAIQEIAEQISVEGQKYTPQVWHRYFKERYLPGRIVELPYGQITEAEPSTTDLTLDEFSEYIERVLQFQAENT